MVQKNFLLFNVLFRNPNSPATVEDLIKTRNDAKRNKMVVWEPFDSQRRYLNLGENYISKLSIYYTHLQEE